MLLAHDDPGRFELGAALERDLGLAVLLRLQGAGGGNGTVWSNSNVNYTYMRIDRAGQAGYLTAA